MGPSIVLIGPMGSGKTTVGKEIASKLGSEFADTDALIEADQGKKVSEIFLDDGEAHFRLVEESIVIDALLSHDGVLSLGGGAIMSDAVCTALENSPAKKIFLDISLSAVASRVGFETARPLLMINPRQKWSELMSARRPIYESLANLKIDVSELSLHEIVDQIVNEL